MQTDNPWLRNIQREEHERATYGAVIAILGQCINFYGVFGFIQTVVEMRRMDHADDGIKPLMALHVAAVLPFLALSLTCLNYLANKLNNFVLLSYFPYFLLLLTFWQLSSLVFSMSSYTQFMFSTGNAFLCLADGPGKLPIACKDAEYFYLNAVLGALVSSFSQTQIALSSLRRAARAL